MKHFSRTFIRQSSVIISLMVLMLVGGCAASGSKPNNEATAPISNNDACAGRMHDISGALLEFYLNNKRLPTNLAELESQPGAEGIATASCPVSGKRYIYSPDGIYMLERNQRVILYDATAAHSGHRWAITVLDPIPGQPLQTRVVGLPESFFLLRR